MLKNLGFEIEVHAGFIITPELLDQYNKQGKIND